MTGTLKDTTNVINPVVLITHENPVVYNYAYIPEFNRYYYINEIVCVRNNLWRLIMHVDVLMSHATQIKNCSAIVTNSETTGADRYLSGNVWRAKVKELTDILTFPSGLSETGEYILITAGGT